MAKGNKPKEPKQRAEEYEPKVKFEGTLEDMIKMAIKPKSKKSK
jgi:hypothetical protein